MAWVQSHQSLLNHRKTLMLADALRIDRFKAIGHLHALWWWGLDNADSEGNFGEASDRAIAIAAGWPDSRAKQFVAAVIDAGFVERQEGGLAFHNWIDYSGGHAEVIDRRREGNRQRKRAQRSRVKEGVTVTPMSRVTRHADVTPDVTPGHADVTALEKRREEKREEEIPSVGSPTEGTAALPLEGSFATDAIGRALEIAGIEISGWVREDLDGWQQEQVPDSWVVAGIRIGTENGPKPWGYVRKCVETLIENGGPKQGRERGDWSAAAAEEPEFQGALVPDMAASRKASLAERMARREAMIAGEEQASQP